MLLLLLKCFLARPRQIPSMRGCCCPCPPLTANHHVPSQGPQNRPSDAPVILGQGPVSRERRQSVNSTYPLSPLPLESENRGLPDDPFAAQPSNQQHSEPQTGQPRFTMLPRPVPATTHRPSRCTSPSGAHAILQSKPCRS
jgi:hypothetical protein